jgi:hypothetical protein
VKLARGPAPVSKQRPTPPNVAPPAVAKRPSNPFGLRTIWKRYLPPVRLVWIFLALLVWHENGLVNRTVAEPLLLLPLVAAVTDLGFQTVRFPHLRFPDAAIANGLFLTVILWPTDVSLALVSVAVATVGVRHAIRVGGHPVLNPAAAGVALAAALFALPQPWHVGTTVVDAALVALLGLILWSRATYSWRILVPYFLVNVGASVAIAQLLGGSHAVPIVVQATVLGSQSLFFGFFMVTEPRTAPSARWAMLVFGGLVGLSAALLPTVFAERPAISALGVLAPYLALFLGNAFAVLLPSARGTRRPNSTPTRVPGRAFARPLNPER